MATLDEIYKLRTQIEKSIRATFEAMDIAALTRQNAPEKFKQARPRIEIKASIGAATGRRAVFAPGIMRFDAWRFSLAIQCISAPANDGKNVLHEDFLGRIRAVIQSIAQVSWNDLINFPNLYIAEPLRDSGTTDTLKTQEGIEYSVLSFDGIICVRTSAWPA